MARPRLIHPIVRLLLAVLPTSLIGQAPRSSLEVIEAKGVTVVVDTVQHRWSAVWSDGTTLRRARFDLALPGTDADQTLVNAPERRRFEDTLGTGEELQQRWTRGPLQVERCLRVYTEGRVITLSGRLTNRGDVPIRLGTLELLDAEGWQLESTAFAPAAVLGTKLAQTGVLPRSSETSREYSASGVLALSASETSRTLLVAHVAAAETAPEITAAYRGRDGGTVLRAPARFLERTLAPGSSIELNRLYFDQGNEPFGPLERLGSAIARLAPAPARTEPMSLWCSWYAHRMAVSEDLVLANAAVAAKHLAPLGFRIMQIDHGWQRGDITGDWFANERFPRGLKWLADELRARHGLQLGLWISPTDVASSSQLYASHPDWMLRGTDGLSKVNWKWYWEPKPDCYQLDVSQPEAYRHVVDTFQRLVSDGVSYFKIDFIGSQARDVFVPADPQATPGWAQLGRAMRAVREGAGDALVRYCQGPPLLSAGLADGAYGGDDTADAGQPGMFRVLRDNARILATSFWLNGRVYRREVCDMSVRMQAPVEEARLRAAMMTLAGTSISWSDELRYLPPSRIRLMQQCLPAGAPPMRPLDLLEREVPSVWHLPTQAAGDTWHVVGLFNFDDQPAVRTVSLRDLGLNPSEPVLAFEFWESRLVFAAEGSLTLTLPAQSSRILAIRADQGRPQWVGDDMHLLQGHHELRRLAWDDASAVLSGTFSRMPGLHQHAFFVVPPGYRPRFDFPLSDQSARLTRVEGNLWMLELTFAATECEWSIPFERDPAPAPVRKEPTT